MLEYVCMNYQADYTKNKDSKHFNKSYLFRGGQR